jgi:hypothetical protein
MIRPTLCKNFGILLGRMNPYFGMKAALPAPSYDGNLKR